MKYLIPLLISTTATTEGKIPDSVCKRFGEVVSVKGQYLQCRHRFTKEHYKVRL